MAPDSFKGSISAADFCRVLAFLLKERAPEEPIIQLPLADGGEGTLCCLCRCAGGRKRFFSVENAYGEPMEAPVGFLKSGAAVIEMAAVAGLPSVSGRENPEATSTYGLGLLIAHAAAAGATEILLTLGGSATHDLGCGMLSALGLQFLDGAGNAFVPTGKTLCAIAAVRKTARFQAFRQLPFRILCDVTNPLLGPLGAAAVFAPQKGADEAMVARLEQGGERAVRVLRGQDAAKKPGAGAAGGLGFGCLRFLNARLERGIDVILDACRFDTLLAGCRLIITGEGRFDAQSLMGKVVGRVVERAGSVPVVVFAGSVQRPVPTGFSNLRAVYAISGDQPLSEAMARAEENLRRAFYESKLPYPYLPVSPRLSL